jgi:catechol 2,3-dioxygenase-like lactoylglutathione lyase family enzyme
VRPQRVRDGAAAEHAPPDAPADSGEAQPALTRTLAAVTLLVDEYDPAIAWFTGVLGFHVVEDTPLDPRKRWVLVEPPGGGTRLLLARAATPEQRARIGDQTGGRVALFLATNRFDADCAALAAVGTPFEGPPRTEPYGRVAVFRDPWGNRWDLLEQA